MKKFVLASHNKKKIAELRAIISKTLGCDFELLSLDEIGYYSEIEENGTSFEENAILKASVPARLGYVGIADDSGLCVDALNGEPGIYSARYSGGNDDDNMNLLLSKMKGKTNRNASFVSTIACVFPDHSHDFTVMGKCYGKILNERVGTGGFGYDPIFYFEPYGKTFGELDPQIKNEISHRSVAVKQFAKKLKEVLENDK